MLNLVLVMFCRFTFVYQVLFPVACCHSTSFSDSIPASVSYCTLYEYTMLQQLEKSLNEANIYYMSIFTLYLSVKVSVVHSPTLSLAGLEV